MMKYSEKEDRCTQTAATDDTPWQYVFISLSHLTCLIQILQNQGFYKNLTQSFRFISFRSESGALRSRLNVWSAKHLAIKHFRLHETCLTGIFIKGFCILRVLAGFIRHLRLVNLPIKIHSSKATKDIF